jgi:ornithine carbamoyltransferase
MAFNLKNRSFLKLLDFSPKEIRFLLDMAAELKTAKYTGLEQPRLSGKNIWIIRTKLTPRIQ